MYILLNWKKFRPYENMKEFVEFTDKLENNKDFKFIDLPNVESIKNYIDEINNLDLKIIFPITARMHNQEFIKQSNIEMIEIVKYTYFKKSKVKIYFTPLDVFMYNTNRELFYTLYKFQTRNIKIIYSLIDDEDYRKNILKLPVSQDLSKVIGKIHPMKYKENNLFCIFNYAYKRAFIPFNNNPINKVCIGGVLHLCTFKTPN